MTPSPQEFGERADKTKKGTGYFGVINRPDGKVSTEISVSFDDVLGGKEIPLIVPTLTSSELKYLIENDVDSPTFMEKMPRSIIDKAADHAILRDKQHKSPFYQEGEERSILPKEFNK